MDDIDNRSNAEPQRDLSEQIFTNRPPLMLQSPPEADPPASVDPPSSAPAPEQPEIRVEPAEANKQLPADTDDIAVLAFKQALAAVTGNTADIGTLQSDIRTLKNDNAPPANVIPNVEGTVVATETPVASGGTPENDHSFHYAPSSTTVGDMSAALIYYQGTQATIAISTGITGSGPWEVTTTAIYRFFYLEVDDSSASGATFTLKRGIKFPSPSSDYKRVYPILEFTDGTDTSTCIEHQQSDIHLDIPPPGGDIYDGMLKWNATDGKIEWFYTDGTSYEVAATDGFGRDVDFDRPRWNEDEP